MRGVFVAGTGTGVGKSIVAAAICAALAARGQTVAAFKPAVTGLDDPPADGWPHDHVLLASAAGSRQSPDEVAPYRFGPALSPHLAAELEEAAVDAKVLVQAARSSAAAADTLVCEGVGGLLVPLAPDYLVRDLAAELALPLVIAAPPELGTINHCLLTIEAARAAALRVAAVVMTPWPAAPASLERSNRETVERIGGVSVAVLPATDPGGLAEAGERLPLADWL